jgi:signal transduction histidine kinase/ligand-binding sensor domain-containing protein/DNA-binding response OmpR family regulator
MMKVFRLITILLLLVLGFKVSRANPSVLPYRFQYYSTEEGLPQNTVDDILMDSKGFIWFATWNGLCRFDGYDFVTFRPDELEIGLPNHFVHCLAENSESQLWIGTAQGAVIYDLTKQKFLKIEFDEDVPIDGIPVKDIYCKNEYVWLATESEGLIVLRKVGQAEYSFVRQLKSGTSPGARNTVNLIFPLSGDVLLIGTNNGAYLLNSKTHQELPNTNLSISTNNANVLSAYHSPEKELWLGSQFSLQRLNENYQTIQQYLNVPNDPSSLVHNSVNAITVDADGNMIIGTLGGLSIYIEDKNEFVNIYAEQGNHYMLNNAFVNSLFCDARGNVWVGTEKGGVNKYNIYQKPFNSLTHNPVDENSISHPTINSIFNEGNNLWIGTAGGGLNLIDRQQDKVFRFRYNPYNERSVSSDFITSIVQGGNGSLYIGTWGSGINEKKTNKINDFLRIINQPSNNSSLTNNFVSSMKIDPRGFIMVGTEGGLDLFNPVDRSFTHVSGSLSGISLSEVGCIELDHRGFYWVGTRKGLYRFPADKVFPGKIMLSESDVKLYKSVATDHKSVPGNYITTIKEDSKGQIWVGTYGNGIGVANMNSDGSFQFENFNQKHGLSNNVVYCIEEGKDGTMWISTDNGLSAFNPITRRFNNFYERDGLLNNQFYWSASFTDREGNIYFGGINGLNYFNPQKMNEYPFRNKVVFTDLKIYNASVKPLDERHGRTVLEKPLFLSDAIKLSYKDNVVSIEFSALDYSFPEKVTYAYQMEGVDKDWVYLSYYRLLPSYPNLRGGDYLFKVKCTNHDGGWSEEVAELKVVIIPPFWEQNWFRITIMISIMLLVMAYIRWSTYSLFEQKKKLEKLVKERTQKIEEQKEILVAQSNSLKNNNLILEQRQKLIEGQKAELESKNAEILQQRDQLIDLNEQVQLVNQLRLRFFTNISHEFRTPLTLIIDPIESLIERLKNDPKTVETLKLINRNAQRLLHLINQLMYFRRVETGKITIRVEKTDVESFVSEIFYSFTDLAHHQHIDYLLQIEKAPAIVVFDKEKMENILYNLLSNAFKFTKPHGKIELRLWYDCNYEGQEQECFCNISVADNGIGIDKADQDLIFDRFYQVENPGTSQIRGSGIGLSLTKELVEALRGNIRIESELGKGATFLLRIPCSMSHFAPDEFSAVSETSDNLIEAQVSLLKEDILRVETSLDESPLEFKDRSKPLILIVEDNFDLRNFLTLSFSEDYRVVDAGNGKEGCDLAARHTPDLIISDIMMPVMDGIEFCSRIKSNIQTSHIPVILLTAKALTENWVEGLEIGADDYVPKPFNLTVLLARVKNLIENRKRLVKLFSKDLFPDVERVTSSTLDEEFLRKTYDILEKYYKQPEFSIEDFAREMCISKSLLYKKLKSLTGMSISDYVNSFKIKKSLALLAEGRLNIADIAFKVGFNDPKYFSRVFRKFIGMTPTGYSGDFEP